MSTHTENMTDAEEHSDVAVLFDSETYREEVIKLLPSEHSLRLLSWSNLLQEKMPYDSEPLVDADTDSLSKRIDEIAKLFKHVLVLTAASTLPDLAPFLRATNKKHHLSALLIRDNEPEWIPQLLNRANVRSLRNTLAHKEVDASIPTRVLRAWTMGAEDELIASARVLNGSLVVMTCAMERVEVEMSKISALRDLGEKERQRVQVSEDGSYLYWETHDISVDTDVIRSLRDGRLGRRSRIKYSTQKETYGSAIRETRKERGLRQTDIEELSSRQVRRIEKGEVSPTFTSLSALAKAHQLEVDEYMSLLAEKSQMHP